MYFAVVLLFLVLVWLIRIEIRMRKAFAGKGGRNLESSLVGLKEEAQTLGERAEKIEREVTTLKQGLNRSVRGVKTKRFNPFRDQGGKQSFATAILDGEGNGVVITGLYSRDKTSVYAKPINSYQSEFELSTEEKDVVNDHKAEH
jgi:hypothetical protein